MQYLVWKTIQQCLQADCQIPWLLCMKLPMPFVCGNYVCLYLLPLWYVAVSIVSYSDVSTRWWIVAYMKHISLHLVSQMWCNTYGVNCCCCVIKYLQCYRLVLNSGPLTHAPVAFKHTVIATFNFSHKCMLSEWLKFSMLQEKNPHITWDNWSRIFCT